MIIIKCMKFCKTTDCHADKTTKINPLFINALEIVLANNLPKISFTCTLINCINLASEFALGSLSLFGL